MKNDILAFAPRNGNLVGSYGSLHIFVYLLTVVYACGICIQDRAFLVEHIVTTLQNRILISLDLSKAFEPFIDEIAVKYIMRSQLPMSPSQYLKVLKFSTNFTQIYFERGERMGQCHKGHLIITCHCLLESETFFQSYTQRSSSQTKYPGCPTSKSTSVPF